MMTQYDSPAAAVRAHEELFAYWSGMRAGGRMPSRGDIHPMHFKPHLPGVSLIDVDDGGYRLRLAGTGLYSVYGREITGMALSDIFGAQAADYWRSELDKVVTHRRPAAGVQSLAWRGASHLSVLWLRLPLSSDGERVDMIFGYDALVGAPSSGAVSGIRAA